MDHFGVEPNRCFLLVAMHFFLLLSNLLFSTVETLVASAFPGSPTAELFSSVKTAIYCRIQESPALRGFVGGPAAGPPSALYLVLKSNAHKTAVFRCSWLSNRTQASQIYTAILSVFCMDSEPPTVPDYLAILFFLSALMRNCLTIRERPR